MNPWLQKIGQRAQPTTDKTDNTPFVSFVGQTWGALTENFAQPALPKHADGCETEWKDNVTATQRLLLFTEDLKELPLTKGDIDFIDHIMGRCSMSQRHELLSNYRCRWIAAHSQEPLPHCRETKGRFAANSWLRTQVI